MPPTRQRPKHAFLQVVGLIFACVLVLTPPSLSAHHLPPEMEEVDEFADAAFQAGLRHPSQGWDHWLLAAAAGLMAATRGKRRDLVFTGLAFAGGLTAGGWLPNLGLPGGLISLSVVGLLLAHFNRPQPWQLAFLGMAALLQTQAQLAAWPWEPVRSDYSAGVLIASAALFALTTCSACLARWLVVPNRELAPA